MKSTDVNKGFPAKNLLRVVLITGLILLLPYLAMKFNWSVPEPGNELSNKVDWKLFDFIVMGTLLLTFGFSYEFLAAKMTTRKQRLMLAVLIGGIFFLIWAELAVGIFGSPFAGS